MISSFRLRLALLSVLLSGFTLAAFGLGVWWLIRDIKIDRIDSEVRAQAEREVSRRRNTEGWQRTASNIGASLSIRSNEDLLLLVQDAEAQPSFRSPHWPAGLDSTSLPWPNPARSGIEARPPPRDRPPPDHPPVRGDEPPRPPDADQPPPRRQPPVVEVITRMVSGHQWRIGLAASDLSRIAVAVNLRTIDAEMASIRNAFLIALPLALLLIGIGAWIFSGRALHPLKKLTVTARNITAAGLDQRIDDQGEDREFSELIEVFNGMLERLERSFLQAHRFSADAAHELKTPLAILQGQLERTINDAETGSPLQKNLVSILDEVRRLATISRKLLLLSQADAGQLNLHRETFDLSAALIDLADDAQMLAPSLRITIDAQPGISITADAALMQMVWHNLVSNAIKYNIDNGWVRIATLTTPQRVVVSVANSSPGIPLSQREKIFERFFRVDSSHNRKIEGVGLGLALSREIIRAHGGELSLAANADGFVAFRAELPR